MKHLVALTVLLMMCTSSAYSETLNEAFSSGKSLGKAKSKTNAQISAGKVSDKIPSYGATAAERNYFQDGNGNTQGFGLSKLSSCAGGGNETDPVKRQECEAVNFLAKNPEIRPRYNISKNDPMILNHKALSDGAEGALAELGLGGTSTNCTTSTEGVPAKYETSTCLSLREVSPEQCTMGRIVKTDADSNFQCVQTTNAYETVTCAKTLSVTVTGSCSGGAEVTEDDYILVATCEHGTLRAGLGVIKNGVGVGGGSNSVITYPSWFGAYVDIAYPDESDAKKLEGKSFEALDGKTYTLGKLGKFQQTGATFQFAGMCGYTGAPIVLAAFGIGAGVCDQKVSTSVSNGCSTLEGRAQ